MALSQRKKMQRDIPAGRMSGIEALIAVLFSYYAGRTRQWWMSRSDRKTAEAIEHIGKTIRSNSKNHKEGDE